MKRQIIFLSDPQIDHRIWQQSTFGEKVETDE